jgi:hypothetical protein
MAVQPATGSGIAEGLGSAVAVAGFVATDYEAGSPDASR